jgi:hypothetical protein
MVHESGDCGFWSIRTYGSLGVPPSERLSFSEIRRSSQRDMGGIRNPQTMSDKLVAAIKGDLLPRHVPLNPSALFRRFPEGNLFGSVDRPCQFLRW